MRKTLYLKFLIGYVLFAVFGTLLVLLCGWALLRGYYLKLYQAAQEEEQTRLESADPDAPPPEKKMTASDRYLEFMYRLFKIKQ